MTARYFLCVFLLSAATLALAQTPAAKRPIHIDGTVVENETRAAIPNARVTLVATENSDQQVTTSDANGRFSFNTIEPAALGLPLRLQASAPGYLVAPEIASANIPVIPGEGYVIVNREDSNYTTELRLTRVSSLKGVLIDQDSKKPIANLNVTALSHRYQGGEIVYFPRNARPVTTGADGVFQFDALPAGDYLLQVQDPLKPKIEPLPAGEVPAPPQGALGYGNVFLPGATADFPEFASIAVRSGAAMDIGQITLRQYRLRNFVGAMDADCRDSERVSIYLNSSGGSRGLVVLSGELRAQMPCGPFRISNVPDGNFTVAVYISSGREAGYGSQTLGPRTDDPLHVRIQPRGLVKGVIEVEDTPADQFPKELEKLFVGFDPKTMPRFYTDLTKDPTSNGKFGGVLYGGVTYEIQTRPPESYYFKRLIYNDVEQPDPFRFTTTPGVVEHSVRIVLSPHPATLQAQVDPGNTVVLIPDDNKAERITLEAGKQQTVTKRGLRPGAYHAFVIPTGSMTALELPGGMDRYLNNAQAVKLEEGQTAAISFVSH